MVSVFVRNTASAFLVVNKMAVAILNLRDGALQYLLKVVMECV
jgi:hypothetical protein